MDDPLVRSLGLLLVYAAIGSQVLPPFIFFVLYVERRDRFSLRALMLFMTAEAIALAIATWTAKYAIVARE